MKRFLLILLNFFGSGYADDGVAFFEAKIRPIFVDRCGECHGGAKTKGGLSLDTRAGWEKGGDSGAVVVPGKPEESLLIKAVSYQDADLAMPPKKKGGKLPDADIAALTEWVKMGAPDPRVVAAKIGGMSPAEAKAWWAFQPLKVVAPPEMKDGAWAQSPIDGFILAGLEKQGLPPAPPADKRTLLRRATFDLTGLPPTPEEIAAFFKDERPNAFARVVDRLLDAPAYGERWGRHWLDVVRYTDYIQRDPKEHPMSAKFELHEAFRYRDWVVEAFNRDLPFDEFIVQQIAGDILADPADGAAYREHLAATGLLSIGTWDVGDADKDKIVSDIVDDQIDVIGRGFLGLTLSCARCHDHKFDPISTEDYYALAGMFYSTRVLADLGKKGEETVIQRRPMLPPAELEQRRLLEQQLAEVTAKLSEVVRHRMFSDLSGGGTVLVPAKFSSATGSKGTINADGSILVGGASAKDTYTVETIVPDGVAMRAIRLEALADATLPAKGPGRAPDGNFVLHRITATFTEPTSPDAPKPVPLVKATADFEQSGYPVAGVLDSKPGGGWAIGPSSGQDHVAVFEVAREIAIPEGSHLTVSLVHNHSDQHAIGKFRLSFLSNSPVLTPPDAETAKLAEARDHLQKELAPPVPLALAVQEGGTPGSLFPAIQDVNLHVRGSYTRLGPVVKRRLPQFFCETSQPEISGSGRLQLARWIASRENPLTARVMVNRVWKHHFGEGLVRTPSNFGKLGEPPSHPELLDWLAAKFMEDSPEGPKTQQPALSGSRTGSTLNSQLSHGWSVKKLHRRIMLSATYQQASAVPKEVAARDPENRWLGRMSSRRLEAEAIHDAMLAVGGELDGALGGPATVDLTTRRRSLYVSTTRWDRSNFSTLFDAANPDQPVESRTSSTVAPQALFLLNNPFVLAEAKHLAARLRAAAPDDPARVRLASELLFARPPTGDELRLALQFIAATSWDDYAHALLCSNEFTYLD